jgi:hypothetical protein
VRYFQTFENNKQPSQVQTWDGCLLPEQYMQTWYSVSLGDGILAPSPAAEIETSFTKLFNAHGKPIEMAVFTRAESEGRLHCEVIAYFSPAAATLAESFDAEPCAKPSHTGLGLLAGDPQAWNVLFPEKEN